MKHLNIVFLTLTVLVSSSIMAAPIEISKSTEVIKYNTHEEIVHDSYLTVQRFLTEVMADKGCTFILKRNVIKLPGLFRKGKYEAKFEAKCYETVTDIDLKLALVLTDLDIEVLFDFTYEEANGSKKNLKGYYILGNGETRPYQLDLANYRDIDWIVFN